ncbi:MAG: hypothetical protein ACREOV_06795 [Candidatus Dormibacteraceae bacterium]
MRRFFLFILAICVCGGLGYGALMLYTHTDPFTTAPRQRQNVPAAAQTQQP